MKQILFLVFIFIGFSNFVFSQSSEKRKIFEIDICQPTITEAGRQSSFQFSYVYRVVADENGSIKEVKEISDNTKFRSLMNDEKVIPCIEKWMLKPSERYFVRINVGTTSEED